MHTNSARKDLLLIVSAVALVLTGVFVIFWNLGNHSISLRSDEVIYVRVSQSVLNDNAWFPLRHGKIAFFEKPPLKLWAGALIPAIIGESTFSYRALDALFAISILVLTILCSKEIFGKSMYGVLAGIVMLGAFEFTASHHGLRRAVLDAAIVSLCLGCALISYRMIRDAGSEGISKRSVLLIGVLCGLGVLTKSVAGLLPLIWIGAYLVLTKRGKGLVRIGIWGFAPAVLIGALYYVPVCLLHSRAADTLFGAELFDRVFEGIEGHNTHDPTFYLRFILKGGILPPVLLVAGTVIAVFLSIKDKRFLFVGVWAYGPVVLFSLSSSKVPWYLHPSVPFLALLCVAAICELPKRFTSKQVVIACTVGCVAITIVSMFQFHRLFRRVVTTVIAQHIRVDVELLVDHIRSYPDDKVIVGDSILSFRSNPKKGRFNVEGFYTNFVRNRIEQVPMTELQQRDAGMIGNALVIVPTAAVNQVPAGATKSIVLPPFGQRFEPMTILAYGNAKMPSLPHLEEEQ